MKTAVKFGFLVVSVFWVFLIFKVSEGGCLFNSRDAPDVPWRYLGPFTVNGKKHLNYVVLLSFWCISLSSDFHQWNLEETGIGDCVTPVTIPGHKKCLQRYIYRATLTLSKYVLKTYILMSFQLVSFKAK